MVMMTMMKLSMLACAKNQKPNLVYLAKNHELKPINTVGTENGPISRESEEVNPYSVYGERSLIRLPHFQTYGKV